MGKPQLVIQDVPGVYRITSDSNGRLYVGSSVTTHSRWLDHQSALNRGNHPNQHLQSAWNKYGPTAFEFELLCSAPPEQLSEKEEWWLDYYRNSIGSRRMYNVSLAATAPMRGRSHTAEARAKISAARKMGRNNMLGRKHSDEARARISAARAGRPHPHKGWAFTAATRAKLSAQKIGPLNPRFNKPGTMLGRTHTEEARAKMRNR